jgi:hypothetical protein
MGKGVPCVIWSIEERRSLDYAVGEFGCGFAAPAISYQMLSRVLVEWLLGHPAASMVMQREQPFSKRHGFSAAKDITIREDAPENLRSFVILTARGLGWQPNTIRDLVCRVLRVLPSEERYHRIWDEATRLVCGCPWFKVYDIIEALHARLAQMEFDVDVKARMFADEMNDFFVDEGIGWQIVEGEIVTRGTEPFEAVVTEAIAP